MFYKSKYYIFASILVVVFQNIDKLLLTELSGTESTGYYSAAVTCTVITQFVFTARRKRTKKNTKHRLFLFTV